MGVFERLDIWRRFGKLTNSARGLDFQERHRALVERAMTPLVRSLDDPPPFAPFNKDLAGARISLVTTTGVYMEGQEPFDVEAQKGDPTFRVIPSNVEVGRLRIAHTHYSHERAERDINVIFPVERLRELVSEGVIGSLAPSFFSYGFDLHVKELVEPGIGTAHQVAALMKEEDVDAALLTPG